MQPRGNSLCSREATPADNVTAVDGRHNAELLLQEKTRGHVGHAKRESALDEELDEHLTRPTWQQRLRHRWLTVDDLRMSLQEGFAFVGLRTAGDEVVARQMFQPRAVAVGADRVVGREAVRDGRRRVESRLLRPSRASRGSCTDDSALCRCRRRRRARARRSSGWRSRRWRRPLVGVSVWFLWADGAFRNGGSWIVGAARARAKNMRNAIVCVRSCRRDGGMCRKVSKSAFSRLL